MPGWHERTKDLVESGKLQTVGIIEEQHPDRTRLFMRWKQMDWPILVDSLNLLDVWVVPLTLLIDEHGVVRYIRPRAEDLQEFLETRYSSDGVPEASRVELEPAAKAFLTGQDPNAIVAAFRKRVEEDPQDGPAHFRLGVALRKQYERTGNVSDFAAAVRHWERALKINPNQYIWRRRIQQYGPRLDKPYSFYDWVNQARADLKARGEEPPPLEVEPGGAEFAHPVEEFTPAAESEEQRNPDPGGRIFLDEEGFVRSEIVIVPHTSSGERSARVHLLLWPNKELKAHWNNEVDDLLFWIDPPPDWEVDRRLVRVPVPPQAVSQETRSVEFEIRGSGPGAVSVPAYALYYVCEDVDGTCLYRRQDFQLRIPAASSGE